MHCKGTKSRRQQGIESLFEKIMTKNLSNLVKENDITSPGNTKSPKQDEPEEAIHMKIHYN